MKNNNSNITIESQKIGSGEPVYFIADIAANHDGDLERAKELIYLAAYAGANAAKFQHFKASTIVSDHGFKTLTSQQSHQAKWNKSVYQVYSDASVNLEWTEILRDTCLKAGITFFTTPYSLDIVDSLDPFVPAYKIGSGDITWHDMIEKVASKMKPYMLATGASTADEVYLAVAKAISINPNLILMQCNTNYTGDLDNFNYIQLNVLKTYGIMFPDLILGLSDHTPGHSTVLGSIALGAKVIEKHFTDNIERVGPDHAFSMDPISWREMVDRSRELEAALGFGIKKIENNEIETVVVQRRSIRAQTNLKKGDVIKKEDFIALRPCPRDAIEPYLFENLIGKNITRDILEGDYLTIHDYI